MKKSMAWIVWHQFYSSQLLVQTEVSLAVGDVDGVLIDDVFVDGVAVDCVVAQDVVVEEMLREETVDADDAGRSHVEEDPVEKALEALNVSCRSFAIFQLRSSLYRVLT